MPLVMIKNHKHSLSYLWYIGTKRITLMPFPLYRLVNILKLDFMLIPKVELYLIFKIGIYTEKFKSWASTFLWNQLILLVLLKLPSMTHLEQNIPIWTEGKQQSIEFCSTTHPLKILNKSI